MKLTKLHARQVFDSRGNPTVEVEAYAGDIMARAIVPSGASTGVHEAIELRDGDKDAFGGKGVLKAVKNVNNAIADVVLGMDFMDQKALDVKMLALDGTENKSKLGANAILGVSLAALKLSAKVKNMPLYERIAEVAKEVTGEEIEPTLLPTPMMNIMNGGKHADSGLAIQELMIMPTGAKSFQEALQIGAEVFHTLKKILKEQGQPTTVGDEGGFAPGFSTSTEALDTIMLAVEKAGHKGKVELASDPAASEFYESGTYHIDGKELSTEELTAFWGELLQKYPFVSLEDSHAEDDWEGFISMQENFGNNIQLVGDDLFVTNKKRLQMGIDKKAANSILIKLNQIGSVTETMETIALARQNNMTCVISHRSGETEDTTIADFAVGMGTGQIKTGSLSRTDRVAKYNQLLRIEEELGNNARFQGKIH